MRWRGGHTCCEIFTSAAKSVATADGTFTYASRNGLCLLQKSRCKRPEQSVWSKSSCVDCAANQGPLESGRAWPALHAVERDRLADAISFDAVTGKTFYFAGCAGPQHAIFFQRRQRIGQRFGIFW